MKTIVVIPARLQSTRLPRKILLEIQGKPIVQWVYEKALAADGIDAVFIATDAEEIRDRCLSFTENIIMTSVDCQSGTDRIAEAAQQMEAEVIINVQGDEPQIPSEIITQLAAEFKSDSTLPMASVMTPIKRCETLNNPNNVKVITNQSGHAIYFSRSPIPFYRDRIEELQSGYVPEDLQYFKHLGIYGYRKSFLLKYAQMAPSYLEGVEKLEQLRAIENGYAIKMIETQHSPIGVDTLEDFEKVKSLMETPNK
ncbi:3-deoxy-manno-octulosonate cytidylyltransferase [Persicobacter psychrovividus]|uniref:3-deoxy-manno-octulosonate cytidylyltransferase n=1 Tax=Persicobacter psychrovividus TaxID=387638 RepID=A0ABM7VBN6_9BACT|nr:3-deoxy-manno-octulosonate cytidylyltransferase [Persicobacter psychrovividus]